MQPYLKRTLILTAFIVFAGFQLKAQEVHTYSLQECIDYALAHQNSIKLSRIAYETALAKNQEVTGLALPHVSANGQVQYLPEIPTQFIPNFISPAVYSVLIKEGVLPEDTKVPSGGTLPAAFGTTYSASATLSVTQTIFDGSVFVALQAKKTVEELAHKGIKRSKIEVKEKVSKAYYNVLISKKKMELVNTNLKRLKQLLHDTRLLYENGFAEQLDVDRVQVQLNNLETEKVKLINLLAISDQLLKYQMGMPLNELLTPSDKLSLLNKEQNVMNIDSFSYDDRIEYSLLETQKKANEFNYKRYKMAALPTLSAFMNYGKNAGRNEFNFFDKDEPWFTSWIIGAKLEVPIFDGFQRKNKAKQAKLDVEKTQIQLDALKQSIDLQIQQSKTTLRNSLINLNAQQDNMTLAESVYDKAKKKYDQGIGSNREVIDAESDLKKAQTNYFDALYNTVIAKIDYKKAIGTL